MTPPDRTDGTGPRFRFRPLFDRIRAHALDHERDRTLPADEVRWLAGAGFGALRLPADQGGGGVSLAEFFALVVDLGAADSNQPQIWRNHIAFVEDRLQPEPADRNDWWRRQLAAGAVVGAAWSERGNATFAEAKTRLTHDTGAGTWVLDGEKYYSTGSNFADWISVAARWDRDEDGAIAVVDARDPGVTVADDWTGFGQRTTGSGTSTFTAVPVADPGLFRFTDRAPYQEAIYQLVHVATLAGIARAAHDDLVAHVRARGRSYPHALSPTPRDDAQLQAVVGRVGALAGAAEAAVARSAGFLDRAADAAIGGADPATVAALVNDAAVAVYEAQITATDDTLAATTLLFDALGSSGVDTSTALDRHWRNARTVTSHNPRVYKERLVGAWYLNGTPPEVYGTPAAGSPTAEAATEAAGEPVGADDSADDSAAAERGEVAGDRVAVG